MTRVASLYLPNWPIDRLRRADRRASRLADAAPAFDAIGEIAAAERAQHCSVPKEGGWRPGARWARSDPGSALADSREQVEAAVQALPVHRRPPQRELGRVSEAAENPFGPLHGSVREMARRTEAAEHPFAPGSRSGGEWLAPDELNTAIAALPAHQRPSFQQLSRRSEVKDNLFRPMPPDEMSGGPAQRWAGPPLQSPGEAPAKAGRGAARRPSSRDGHNGEAGAIPPSSLARLAAMPAVQFPGEGPHPDNHGKNAPTALSYGEGCFFQTGRTLGSVVARVCREDGPPMIASPEAPLVTVHKIGARVEIAAASPGARALGLGPGVALTQARVQVPGLDVRPADPDGDRADLQALAERLARRWTPVVNVSDADGLLLDLTGVAHLHGGEARMLRRLVRLLARAGVSARAAVADTAGAAWAAARFGATRAGGPESAG